MLTTSHITAFAGHQVIATGPLSAVAQVAKEWIDSHEDTALFVFEDATGKHIELDLRGTSAEVLARLPAPPPPVVEPESDGGNSGASGPGRPRLGVIAREVTLLPRHWEWLNYQPGGASVALRKLVEEARRANSARDRIRAAQEATYHFMTAMGGNLPGFEEASRALFAGNRERFHECIADWPKDVQEYAIRLSSGVFLSPEETVA